MAGNFWQSSHYQQWVLDKQEVLALRGPDLRVLSEEEYEKLLIFFCNITQQLGEQVKVRQQVIATASVYLRRYYARNTLGSIDPFLLVPAALFLASKVEEYGIISASKLVTFMANIVKNKHMEIEVGPGKARKPIEFNHSSKHIHEVEFLLLEQMDCCLIVYHPYRPLVEYVNDATESALAAGSTGGDKDSLLGLSWRIVNDSLRTDVALLFPPFQIALACLHMASVILNKDLKAWFSELAVDMEAVLEVSRHLFALYSLWKATDERTDIPPLLSKMPKPNLTGLRDSMSRPDAKQEHP